MAADYHGNNLYDNGVFDLWETTTWAGDFVVVDGIARADILAGKSPTQIAADVSAWETKYAQNIKTAWPRKLPLTALDVFNQDAPATYQIWAQHPYYDDYWAKIDTSSRYPQITVPALISGDWYDPFHIGTIETYYGMRTKAGNREAREGTRLIMGAYGHSGDSGTPTFGNDTPDPSLTTKFFDYYLKGEINNGELNAPRVNLYVLVPPNWGNTGTGFWVSGSDFPLPGTESLRLYLTSRGHANTSGGDGALVAAPLSDDGGRGPSTQQSDPPDQFTYDPGNPVPTTGGNMCCDTANLPAGARDQTAVEQRPDVLVYAGPALTQDTPVIGTVTAHFWAVTDRVDTDFTVKLVDIHPDGKTHNVLDRIVRGRLRQGSRLPPSLLRPGEDYEYHLSLGSTATIFRAGHKVRVEISSSNFPHYSRNLNTAEDPISGSTYEVAHQTILHDRQHPSFIELPVHYETRIPNTIASTQ
jgi:putative CocE/NonD family hydrolase